jgi:hypothetical protein
MEEELNNLRKVTDEMMFKNKGLENKLRRFENSKPPSYGQPSPPPVYTFI